MKKLWSYLKKSFLLLTVFSLLLGVIYPLMITLFGNLLFPKETQGSFIYQNGKAIGSEWIGQSFNLPKYFHPRPSFKEKPYDPLGSSASNFGPTSLMLTQELTKNLETYRRENNLSLETLIPVDAVTSSASGLDPHISLENALLQLKRVSLARDIPEEILRKLIETHTQKPFLGLFGKKRVHVLRLNLALDRL